MIVGDVLFAGSIGRTDFPRGDYDTLIRSITERLLPMGDDVTFVPGHGPTSTLGEERRTNPFLVDPERYRGHPEIRVDEIEGLSLQVEEPEHGGVKANFPREVAKNIGLERHSIQSDLHPNGEHTLRTAAPIVLFFSYKLTDTANCC